MKRRGTVNRRAEGTGGAPTRFAPATLAALGRGVATRPRKWLIAVTLLLGVLAGVGMVAVAQSADQTFVSVSKSAQSLMSVTLPFLGVLLVRDVLRSPGAVALAPTLLAATLLAVVVGAFGVVVCAVALAVVPSGATMGRWDHTATITACSLLVQVVAQLVGTGLGLLLRPAVIACLGTIVLPLGLWFVLGSMAVIRPAQAWLTPYPTVQNLLSGRMSALAWAQWSVVVLLWGAALNGLGAARRGRGGSRDRPRS